MFFNKIGFLPNDLVIHLPKKPFELLNVFQIHKPMGKGERKELLPNKAPLG